jgi:hypothetical protein
MIGIICFLIVVVLANILTFYVASPYYHSAVTFIDENFWLLVLIALLLFIGDLFRAFPFPINLPSPIIKAIGSIFCIAFILKLFQWIDLVTSTRLYDLSWFLSFFIVPLVFLAVLAVGYFEIFRQIWWQPRSEPDESVVIGPESEAGQEHQPAQDIKSWEDIGAEFRLFAYDLLHRFREEIKRKR